MSKMHYYTVKTPKGAITIDQLMQIMEAMGLNPKLYDKQMTVSSYTDQDQAVGNLTIDTSILGGTARQKTGVASVRWNPVTKIVNGDIDLRIDSWGVDSRTRQMTQKLSSGLQLITSATNQAAKLSQQVRFNLPGLTVAQATELLVSLGAKFATQTLLSQKGTAKNLASTYLNRKQAVKDSVTSAVDKATDTEVTDLLQIAPKAMNIEIDLSVNGSSKTLQVGFIPPVMRLEATNGGVDAILPQAFLEAARPALENARNLGMGMMLVEQQAKQHVGPGEVKTNVEISSGKVVKVDVEWERRELTETEKAVQARAAELKGGKVEVAKEEADAVLAQAAVLDKPIDVKPLRRRIVDDALSKQVQQFVLA